MILIGFELRRIIGRRGSFFGSMGVAFAIALLVAVLIHSRDQTEEVWSNALALPIVLGATVVGALAGSYDAAQGTMRYLVLTGVPRWKLVAIRVPAVTVAIVLLALPAVLVGFVAMQGGPEDGAAISRALLGTAIACIVWGLVAMVVGTLLRSNGAGIAVALVLFLAGVVVTAAVQSQVSQRAGDLLLPNVVDVISVFGEAPSQDSSGNTLGLGGAVIALVVWLAGLTGLAIVRVERDEY